MVYRRIGKSSLVKVAMRESRMPFVLVDVRELYYAENLVTMQYLVKHLVQGFKKHMRWYEKIGFNLREALKRVKSIRVSGYEVEVEPTARIPLTTLLSEINQWCTRHGLRFIFVFDEAQYLRFSNVRYDGLIAWAVDNLEGITFILTGSEVGVLRDFLRLEDPAAPLYGRYRREVYVDRFTREESISFLEQGFREMGLKPMVEELEEASERLGGIVGWLTLYGYYRVAYGLAHREALSRVFMEGSKIALSELEKVIAPSRRRYKAVLKAVAQGASTWSDIKAYTIARTGPITDRRFTSLLKNLVKYGYLQKKGNKYSIPDPIVEYLAKQEL